MKTFLKLDDPGILWQWMIPAEVNWMIRNRHGPDSRGDPRKGKPEILMPRTVDFMPKELVHLGPDSGSCGSAVRENRGGAKAQRRRRFLVAGYKLLATSC